MKLSPVLSVAADGLNLPEGQDARSLRAGSLSPGARKWTTRRRYTRDRSAQSSDRKNARPEVDRLGGYYSSRTG